MKALGNLSLEDKKEKEHPLLYKKSDEVWLWMAYECCPSTETRGKNKTTSNCYKWSLRRTKKTINEIENRKGGHIQMDCPNCVARPRKNCAAIWFFDNEITALQFVKRMNEESFSNAFGF